MDELDDIGRKLADIMTEDGGEADIDKLTNDPRALALMSQIVNLEEAWELFSPCLNEEGERVIKGLRTLLQGHFYSVLEGTEPPRVDGKGAVDGFIASALISVLGAAMSIKEVRS